MILFQAWSWWIQNCLVQTTRGGEGSGDGGKDGAVSLGQQIFLGRGIGALLQSRFGRELILLVILYGVLYRVEEYHESFLKMRMVPL